MNGAAAEQSPVMSEANMAWVGVHGALVVLIALALYAPSAQFDFEPVGVLLLAVLVV